MAESTSEQKAASSQWDLTTKLSPYLDRHLVFPLLEFVEVRGMYPDRQILQVKLDLLSQTNMVDFAMDIYKTLNNAEDVPEDMTNRRQQVVQQLKSLESQVAPLLELFENAEEVKNLRNQKLFNLQYLQERYEIEPAAVEALYTYAKFQSDCGNYSAAAEYLYHYRVLASEAEATRQLSGSLVSEHNIAAMWGKLAAEILMQNWEAALEDFNVLKDFIDGKRYTNPAEQLLHRCWIIHWGLFVFFNHPNGRQHLIDVLFHDRYLSTIQACCPHILRYLITAVICSKRRRYQLREMANLLAQERHEYSDPITEFVLALFHECDFDGAQQKLNECSDVLLNDFFLVACHQEFIETARSLVFEMYCRIHQTVDISMLGEKLDMADDEAERWIVNLVRNARLDAKIDSQSNTVVMGSFTPNIYQQIIDKTKGLSFRSLVVANNVERRRNPGRSGKGGRHRGKQTS